MIIDQQEIRTKVKECERHLVWTQGELTKHLSTTNPYLGLGWKIDERYYMNSVHFTRLMREISGIYSSYGENFSGITKMIKRGKCKEYEWYYIYTNDLTVEQEELTKHLKTRCAYDILGWKAKDWGMNSVLLTIMKHEINADRSEKEKDGGEKKISQIGFQYP